MDALVPVFFWLPYIIFEPLGIVRPETMERIDDGIAILFRSCQNAESVDIKNLIYGDSFERNLTVCAEDIFLTVH